MQPLLSVKNLSVQFGELQIFSDLNFEINNGDKVAVTGESGSGKTTLLNTLCGFNTNFKGEIIIAGMTLNKENIFEIRKHIAWLPQEITGGMETAEELFYFPFTFKANKHLMPTKQQIEEILNEFGLTPAILKKRIQEISGGQKQRIALASILLLKKDIIFLDEPTSALDDKNIKKVADYILDNKDLTVIATSHNKYWTSKSGKIINIEEYARNS